MSILKFLFSSFFLLLSIGINAQTTDSTINSSKFGSFTIKREPIKVSGDVKTLGGYTMPIAPIIINFTMPCGPPPGGNTRVGIRLGYGEVIKNNSYLLISGLIIEPGYHIVLSGTIGTNKKVYGLNIGIEKILLERNDWHQHKIITIGLDLGSSMMKKKLSLIQETYLSFSIPVHALNALELSTGYLLSYTKEQPSGNPNIRLSYTISIDY